MHFALFFIDSLKFKGAWQFSSQGKSWHRTLVEFGLFETPIRRRRLRQDCTLQEDHFLYGMEIVAKINWDFELVGKLSLDDGRPREDGYVFALHPHNLPCFLLETSTLWSPFLFQDTSVIFHVHLMYRSRCQRFNPCICNSGCMFLEYELWSCPCLPLQNPTSSLVLCLHCCSSR